METNKKSSGLTNSFLAIIAIGVVAIAYYMLFIEQQLENQRQEIIINYLKSNEAEGDCRQYIDNIDYDLAMEYISNYEGSINLFSTKMAAEGTSAESFVEDYPFRENEYPHGEKIETCYVFGLNESRINYQDKLGEFDFGGVEVHYGLENSADSKLNSLAIADLIKSDRIALILPIKNDGSDYDQETIYEQRVRIVKINQLDPDYHDLCPPLCDY